MLTLEVLYVHITVTQTHRIVKNTPWKVNPFITHGTHIKGILTFEVKKRNLNRRSLMRKNEDNACLT